MPLVPHIRHGSCVLLTAPMNAMPFPPRLFLKEAIRPRPSDRLNLLIVSREHPTWIRDSLGAWSRIRLDPDAKDDVQDSLSAYIFTRTEELACSVVKRYSQSSLGKSDPH